MQVVIFDKLDLCSVFHGYWCGMILFNHIKLLSHRVNSIYQGICSITQDVQDGPIRLGKDHSIPRVLKILNG